MYAFVLTLVMVIAVRLKDPGPHTGRGYWWSITNSRPSRWRGGGRTPLSRWAGTRFLRAWSGASYDDGRKGKPQSCVVRTMLFARQTTRSKSPPCGADDRSMLYTLVTHLRDQFDRPELPSSTGATTTVKPFFHSTTSSQVLYFGSNRTSP